LPVFQVFSEEARAFLPGKQEFKNLFFYQFYFLFRIQFFNVY